MKSMYRYLALGAAALMMFGAMTACGGETAPEGSDPASTVSTMDEPGGNDIISPDFGGETGETNDQGEPLVTSSGGKTTKAGNTPGGDNTPDASTPGGDASRATGGAGQKFPGKVSNLNGRTLTFAMSYMAPGTGSDQAKRAAALYKELEEEFNCKIVFNTSITYDQMAASIKSGAPKADVWFAANHKEYINQVKGNLIAKLDNLQVTDFRDTTKYSAAGQLGEVGGSFYGVCPLTYGVTGGSALVYDVLFFNKTLLKNAGYSAESLYQLQNSGGWTWDKFSEVAGKVTQGSTYAINDSERYFYVGLLSSNGAEWVTKSGGSLVFTGGDAKNQQVLEYMTGLAKSGALKMDSAEVSSTTAQQEFIAGRAAFYAHPVFAARDRLAGANIDWGILAMPKAPGAKDYVADSSWASFYVIPSGVAKPNEPLTIVDEIFSRPLYNEAEDEAQYTAFYSQYLKDTQSLETIKMLRSKEKQTWWRATESIGLTTNDSVSWFLKVGEIVNGASIATVTGSVTQQYNNLLNDMFGKK